MSNQARGAIQLPVEKLRIGLYVDIGLPWNQHPFLFRRFRIKNQQEIDTIKSLISDTVLVYPRKSVVGQDELDESPQDTLAGDERPEEALWSQKRERLAAAKAYRNERRRLMKEYRETSERVRRLTNDLPTAPANAMKDAQLIVNDMVGHFEQGESVLMNLVLRPALSPKEPLINDLKIRH